MKPTAKQTNWLEYTVTEADTASTVQEILTGRMGVSRRMIQKLTRHKGILVNNKPAFLKRTVKAGDIVKAKVGFAEAESLEPEAIPLNIVYEDTDLLILNKPPGIAVHPTQPGQKGTLAHGVAYYFREQGIPAKVRPLHRLDLNTSGLIVFAKNAMAHHQLDSQLKADSIKREYLAIVEGTLNEDSFSIDLPIGRQPGHPSKRTVTARGEQAVTHVRLQQHLSDASVVELSLETGRTHQIRVHLSHLGHPVWGDYLYGAKRTNLIHRQALHAFRLSLSQPATGQQFSFEAPLPQDMVELLEKLKGSNG